MKKIIFLSFIAIYSCNTKMPKNKAHEEIRKIVNQTQEIISVKKGEKIDTARFRTLFLPSAHFIVVGEENGKRVHETMNLDEFLVLLTDEYYTNGYFETGKGDIIEEYNGIAHTMQSFYGEDSEGMKDWGVGSQQLIFSDGRWWIANMIWTSSTNGKDGVPKKYLKN